VRPPSRPFLTSLLVTALCHLPAQAQVSEGRDRITKGRAWFTDTVLVDQSGRRLRFFEDVLKDKVVVLNFIYARCSDACPLITRHLADVRTQLGPRFGPDVRFVSISIDPEHDRPADLAAFALRQQADVPGWLFLTGRVASVDRVVKRLGQAVGDPAAHATLLIAGNVLTGRWAKLPPDTPAPALAAKVRQLGGWD